MKLLAALQKEAQKLTKAKDSLERQLNAISAAVKALDRKSTRLNSSHGYISYAVFCLKKNKDRRRECLEPTPRILLQHRLRRRSTLPVHPPDGRFARDYPLRPHPLTPPPPCQARTVQR